MYRLDPDTPTQFRTARADLAAAMVAELRSDDHVHRAVALRRHVAADAGATPPPVRHRSP